VKTAKKDCPRRLAAVQCPQKNEGAATPTSVLHRRSSNNRAGTLGCGHTLLLSSIRPHNQNGITEVAASRRRPDYAFDLQAFRLHDKATHARTVSHDHFIHRPTFCKA